MTDDNKRDLVVSRLFNAPLSLVWKAWLTNFVSTGLGAVQSCYEE